MSEYQILVVTDECIERLKREGTEDLELPDGKKIRLSYTNNEETKKFFAKHQPKKGCYVGPIVHD